MLAGESIVTVPCGLRDSQEKGVNKANTLTIKLTGGCTDVGIMIQT